jgi:hypothetical protein
LSLLRSQDGEDNNNKRKHKGTRIEEKKTCYRRLFLPLLFLFPYDSLFFPGATFMTCRLKVAPPGEIPLLLLQP